MRLILLGSPGAGKGTQAHNLVQQFNIPQISTGDILRGAIASGSALGQTAKKIMQAGELVSDDIILALVKERLKSADCKQGYLFDGFPRTLAQAQALEEQKISVDFVIELSVPDEEIINRLTGRRIHLSSGRTYHIEFNPPKTQGLDDITQEALVQREDDKEETIKKRLAVYHSQTQPLVDFYKRRSLQISSSGYIHPKFFTIKANQSVSGVFHDILASMEIDYVNG